MREAIREGMREGMRGDEEANRRRERISSAGGVHQHSSALRHLAMMT